MGSWVPGWLDEQVTKRLSCMPPSVVVECPTGCCQKVHRNFTGLRIVLQGIEARDGHPADIDNLWLTDGASPAVHYMMKALLRSADIRSNIVERARTGSMARLAGGILRAVSQKPALAGSESGFRTFMKNVNRLGGGVLFELMEPGDIDRWLEKCLPKLQEATAGSAGIGLRK